MCSFDPNDLNNLVLPCADENTDDQAPEDDDSTPVGGSVCTSQCVVHNTCPSNSCKGNTPPDPMWGFGGLSIDEEENNN